MNKSIIVAVVAVVALVLWMLSGQLGNEPAASAEATEPRSTEVVAMKVQTRRQSSEEVTREVIIQGQVEPIKVVAIRSETTGSIESVSVDKGERIEKDDVIATMSADNREALPQQNISDVAIGTEASAELITGEALSGTVHYVSSMADSSTRSFRVEVLVPSPPDAAKTGISAEIRIPVETIRAHLISPAILALDESGTLGVKAVSDQDEVVFHAIEVVKTESNGAWVTGIPDDSEIITLGQGFVNAGETVQAVPESDSDSVDDNRISGQADPHRQSDQDS